MSFQGKPNTYTCPVCTQVLVTVDLDAGTTPMMLGCARTPGCSGMMVSACYDVDPALVARATHEWYHPELMDGLDDVTQEHVRKGGLLLRPRPGTPAPAPARTPAPPRAKGARGALAAAAALGRGLPMRLWRRSSKMAPVSLTARIRTAATLRDLEGVLAEGAGYPNASEKSRRVWAEIAATRRRELEAVPTPASAGGE